MTNPNVTMRQARRALRFLVAGAAHELDHAGKGDQREAQDNATWLLDELAEELAGFTTTIPTDAQRAWSLIGEMQEMLGSDTCPTEIRELLAKHDMNP